MAYIIIDICGLVMPEKAILSNTHEFYCSITISKKHK
jgi:hypothetical protein